MKSLVVMVLVAAVLLGWYLRRSGTRTPATGVASAAHEASAPGTSPASTSPTTQKPPAHATQLSPDERRRVAGQIATAHAAHHVPAAPSLPSAKPALDPADSEGMKTTIRAAMKEVIPMLGDCYDKAGSAVGPDITVAAHLVLTGDPDIGTLIDASGLTDPAGGSFDKGFDDCIRSTLQSIELPPLAEGDEVSVTYPFVFRRE